MKRIATILALALMLALPASTFAANTGSTSDTLASVVTITLNGVPTTHDYGTVSPVTTNRINWKSPAQSNASNSTGEGDTTKFGPITFGADAGTTTLAISGDALARSGGGTYAATNRRFCVQNAAPTNGAFVGSPMSCQVGASTYGTTSTTIASSNANVNASFSMNLGLLINSVPAGAYTGTVTWTVS